VPIVTTQGEYRYVGRLTTLFDSEGRLTAVEDTTSGPVRVSATQADSDFAPADAGLQQSVVAPLTAYSAELAARKIGTTEQTLNGGNPDPIRQRESNLGDLVADGFRYTTNKAQQSSGGPIADIAFSNGGGIRASIPAGDISEKSTFDVLPFDNTMVTVTGVAPERFKRLMEHGVAFFSASVNSNGRFPQISGYTMTVDRTRQAQVLDAQGNVTTPGERIRELTLDDGTKIVEGGVLVPGARSVNIATTNFTAGGGDSYPFRGLTSVPARQNGGFVPYQQSLFQYITDPSSSVVAGLAARGGSVTGASHPGTGRITFTS
jgi:5'-nucleotidase